jgi:hypothetical protein
MVHIDFQGGTHGNYLEFVCNKFLGGVPVHGTPFNDLGASHNKKYLDEKKFEAQHYFHYQSFSKKTIIENSKIISIQIVPDDLLPLSSVSLLRAGDYSINNNQLEINTYNKLNNISYQLVLTNLISNYFQSQIQESYDAVKAPTWPPVSTLEDFKKLPTWIQEECLTQHNLELLDLSLESPNCPRYVLREFFKTGFKNPEISGFMTQQEKMTYNDSNDVYLFPFGCFYETESFIHQLSNLAKWLNYEFTNIEELLIIHQTFLEKQPYKNSKKLCDNLLTKLILKEQFKFPQLDLMQESYLAAKLELYYNVELPNNNIWFSDSQSIFEFVNGKANQ